MLTKPFVAIVSEFCERHHIKKGGEILMDDPKKARAILKETLQKKEPVIAAGAYDALTAAVVEYLGFNACYMGGWMTGACLGVTEPLLTLSEQTENAKRATRLINIPLIVDGHTGFGDPLHVYRAVREYEDAGISGMHIEDQVYPKRAHYFSGKEHTVSDEEFLARIKYAVKARRDPNFLIIARTDTKTSVEGGSFEALKERVKLLGDTEADVIMPHWCSPKELEECKKVMPKDKLLLGQNGPLFDPKASFKDYINAGCDIIINPLPTIIATIGAAVSLNRSLKENGKYPESGMIGFDAGKTDEIRLLIEKLIKIPEYQQIEKETVER